MKNNKIISNLRIEYEILFMNKVNELVEIRKNFNIKQYELAKICQCSIKKIQDFEAHKCLDAFLLFIYKKQLK